MLSLALNYVSLTKLLCESNEKVLAKLNKSQHICPTSIFMHRETRKIVTIPSILESSFHRSQRPLCAFIEYDPLSLPFSQLFFMNSRRPHVMISARTKED